MIQQSQLQKVQTFIETYNANKNGWMQPFNQALFLNYDTVNPVIINGFPIAPGQAVAANTYPTPFGISLNVGEVNTTVFSIDFGGSTTALLRIVYTKYVY